MNPVMLASIHAKNGNVTALDEFWQQHLWTVDEGYIIKAKGQAK